MIKNHRNKNDYYYAGSGLWVRNFTKKLTSPIDINDLIPQADMMTMLGNENSNHSKMLQRIDTESFNHNKIVIVSDGYKFEEKHKLLEKLPNDVTIIGVSETLVKWESARKMQYYVVNNPFEDCLQLLPKQQKIFPKCIASMRTNPEFTERFNGIVYSYSPTTTINYCGQRSEADYFIDDYRNPICAAIGLSYRFNVQKLLLFCCDDVYNEYRPATEKLNNGLWIYPQQKVAHDLIDGNLYWLKKANINIGYNSDGPEYKHAEYIKEGDIIKFFVQ